MNATLATPRPTASTPSAPSPRPRLRGFAAEAVFVGRSLRHSVRDGESLLMAIMLPVMLMLMFTWVFGGAIDPSGAYVDYVVPGIILTCAGFGASSTAVYVANDMRTGIIDRIRTMPLRAGAVLTGHVVASVLRNLVATAIVIGVGVLVGFRPTADLGEWIALAGLITCTSSRSPTCSRPSVSPQEPGGRERLRFRPAVPALSLQRVRTRREHAGVAAADRGQPADHAHRRDDPRPPDGYAPTGRGMVGDRLVPGHPADRGDVGRVALPPQGGTSLRMPQAPRRLSALATACFAEAAARPTTSAACAALSFTG